MAAAEEENGQYSLLWLGTPRGFENQLISSCPHWVGPPELKRSEGFSLLFPTPSFVVRQTRMSQGWPFCAQVLLCGGREQHLLPGWHCLPWLSTARSSYSLGLTKTAKSPNDWWVLSCHSDHLINDTARCPTTKSNRQRPFPKTEWAVKVGQTMRRELEFLSALLGCSSKIRTKL